MSVKSDFASIYSQWEKSHDESSEIKKLLKEENTKERTPEITVNELKRMKVQEELDLHNFTVEEALKEVADFISNSKKKGLRKIRLITGKGLHSPNGLSVIRPEVLYFLKSNKNVSSFDQNPKPVDGGSGAVIVYLKR